MDAADRLRACTIRGRRRCAKARAAARCQSHGRSDRRDQSRYRGRQGAVERSEPAAIRREKRRKDAAGRRTMAGKRREKKKKPHHPQQDRAQKSRPPAKGGGRLKTGPGGGEAPGGGFGFFSHLAP